MIQIIETDRAPKAIGPYSQAVIAGNFIYLSGQIPLDPETSTVVEPDITLQTRQVLNNIKSILDYQKVGLNQIIKTTIFIKDMNQFPMVNQIYEEFLGSHRPARSTVEVSRLPKDVLIEIETIAML